MKRTMLVLLLTASVAHGEIYTWKDSRGTDHYSNSTYDIPKQYRAKAKVLDMGIPDKSASAPQNGQAPAATPEGQPALQAPDRNPVPQASPAPPAAVRQETPRRHRSERQRRRAVHRTDDD